MAEPRIAVPLINNRLDLIKSIEPLIDVWEIRLDLIGPDWPEVVKKLQKPWIACNRSPQEGGRGQSEEQARITELLKGLAAGAAIVDIELNSPMLDETVMRIKKRAQCLISYHNLLETPDINFLTEVARRQQKAGADICKIVTHARVMGDNLLLLQLIKQNPDIRMAAFAMGAEGRLSRVLSPLAGAYFTFASIEYGQESASGQIAVQEMRTIYNLIKCT